ncbi:MAG: tRNA (adenosine(37)-N6)-threonylcarbamoyltransferase complex ATPase subunit type 1 TsaE [Parcubacteria group bacterium SW_6_46_9]|nr:MAG: tRNA (adenosine(37)-N6)-threonylcarbamoyltransferase complex ATPase subunit type 1 TsaE [Parcubacteria group bacterium SW_6_46_9]
MDVVAETVDQTHSVAADLLESLQPQDNQATVVGFSGPLGAGKTEFIRGLLRSAGIESAVTSPTYTIETVYKLPKTSFDHAYHVDAYRLEDGSDLQDIGFENRLTDPKNLVLVEWADSVAGKLSEKTISVDISIKDDKRVIAIKHEQGE